jgi:hypothetical protein
MTGAIEGDRKRPKGTHHFIAPTGLGSVVKYFLQISGKNKIATQPKASFPYG